MIVWSMSLRSAQIRALRRIAAAKTGNEEFVGPSKYDTVYKSLRLRGLVTAKEKTRKRGPSIGGTPSTYVLTELGAAILSIINSEIGGLVPGKDDDDDA